MKVIFILVAASILVASGFLVAFLWAVRNGQYDDDYTPSVRILFDEDKVPDNNKEIEQSDDDSLAENDNT